MATASTTAYSNIQSNIKQQLLPTDDPSTNRPAPYALLPTHTSLYGTHVTLHRLTLASLASLNSNGTTTLTSLFTSLGGPSNAALWKCLKRGPFDTIADLRACLENYLSEDTERAFWSVHPHQKSLITRTANDIIINNRTTVTNNTDSPVLNPTPAAGLVALCSISTHHATVEIGPVVYGPTLQRTVAATEAIYMILRHVFDDLNYARCVWECDLLNTASERAALRLGLVGEGLLRSHLVVKGGRRRSSFVFGLLRGEWARGFGDEEEGQGIEGGKGGEVRRALSFGFKLGILMTMVARGRVWRRSAGDWRRRRRRK